MKSDFANQLIREIVSDAKNYWTDNYDAERFGVRPRPPYSWLKFFQNKNEEEPFPGFIDFDFVGLEETYARLDDVTSKALLVKIFAYRVLGARRVKLPANTPAYWSELANIKALASRDNELPIAFMNWRLSKFSLNSLGFSLTLYSVPAGVLTLFSLKQYEYHLPTGVFAVEAGDVVIDAGGCWGDSALRFAAQVGETGRVYSFEFVAANLDVFHQNLALNPCLKDKVEIVQQPLWDVSSVPVYCLDNGPGSRVSFEPIADAAYQVDTVTIDDWVAKNKLHQVDFIKMDIEGAELPALRGAETVLRRFRPKLAISVYHRLSDMVDIPRYLDQLGLGYRFYLGHYTIHLEETVLYAVPARCE